MSSGFNDIIAASDSDRRDLLLVTYPSVSAELNEYNPATEKIEAGAKSALDPSRIKVITPYLAKEVPSLAQSVTFNL